MKQEKCLGKCLTYDRCSINWSMLPSSAGLYPTVHQTEQHVQEWAKWILIWGKMESRKRKEHRVITFEIGLHLEKEKSNTSQIGNEITQAYISLILVSSNLWGPFLVSFSSTFPVAFQKIIALCFGYLFWCYIFKLGLLCFQWFKGSGLTVVVYNIS